jgi:hypothetical protein
MGWPPVRQVIPNHASPAARVITVIRDSILKHAGDDDRVSRIRVYYRSRNGIADRSVALFCVLTDDLEPRGKNLHR